MTPEIHHHHDYTLPQRVIWHAAQLIGWQWVAIFFLIGFVIGAISAFFMFREKIRDFFGPTLRVLNNWVNRKG